MRLLFLILLLTMVIPSIALAAPISWVDLQVTAEALQYAVQEDIATSEQEEHKDIVSLLAMAAVQSGGNVKRSNVEWASKNWTALQNRFAQEKSSVYQYYHQAYTAAFGGLMGHFCITVDGEDRPIYGLKAFSPIAAGYGYAHCDDFGANRSFGFRRKHLGHDLMGGTGTPIVAVEGGIVEAMGWNRYGGWRVGIRSFDGYRYYYYAHLKKDAPFAPGLEVGDIVEAGDCIGFMGQTGYSDTPNTNNIQEVHLHFGMQLIFDESQKECNSEIWVDVYPLVTLLDQHRSSLMKNGSRWDRKYPFTDLDVPYYPAKSPPYSEINS